MWLPALALCMLVASAGGLFITTGQEDVCDEDPHLLAELRRRTNHDDLIKSFRPLKIPPNMFPKRFIDRVPAAPSTKKYELRGNKVNGSQSNNYRNRRANNNANNKTQNNANNNANNSRKANNNADINNDIKINITPKQSQDLRKRWGLHKEEWYPTIPPDRAVRHHMVDMVEQAIYAAQYRLKDLEPIAKKYTERLEYRISYIFKRLEWIEHEMELMYSYLEPVAVNWWNDVRIFQYIVYYEDVLAKHVDVTYICERLAFLHGHQEGRVGKDRAAHKQEHRSTLPANMTDRYTGAMDLEDVIRAEKERERQNKLRQEQD